jgi:amino acid transporter
LLGLAAWRNLRRRCSHLGAIYIGDLLNAVDIDATSRGWQIVFFALLAVVVTAFAFHGVRLSTRTALILEATTLVILGVILAATLLTVPEVFDSRQLQLDGASPHDIFLGITLAVTAFVGFESGASLGAEARNPHKAIARVVMFTAVCAGAIYIFATYTSIAGFGGIGTRITDSASPIDDLPATAASSSSATRSPRASR